MRFLVASSLAFGLSAASYSCIDFDVPLSFTAPYANLSFVPQFENHYQTVAFLSAITARNAQSPPAPDMVNTTVKGTIAAHYCTPKGSKPTTAQVLTHGLGFDSSYWDFGGPGSEYNYIEAATAAGFAVLSYDRLGNGKSTIKDPYTVQQLGPETGVLVALTTLLREGGLSKLAGSKISVPKQVVHVGHSYGSAISNLLVGIHPELSDGIVMTGYSTNTSWNSHFAISSNLHIAKENTPRFKAYESNGWLTWGDELSNQYNFLHYPAFDPKVLKTAEATKYPFSVGEFLSGASTNATAWTGPALLISGQYDLIFCGSWCPGILRQAKSYFPKAKPFETYVQPDTGHGMNLHHNATGTYNVINDFIKANVA